MHVVDDLMLFVSSLDSTMLGIGTVVCGDQKQCVQRPKMPNMGFSSGSLISGNFPDSGFMFFA